jgi:hypothetical protein
MSLKKFNKNDVLLNTLRAYPSCQFFIYNGQVNWNSIPEQSGAFSAQVRNVPPGYISLYEYNIDTITGSDPLASNSGDNPPSYPFITKGSARASFRTTLAESSTDGLSPNEWAAADTATTLVASYPLSASITREYMPAADVSTNSHFISLQNRLNYYGTRSPHYKVSSSFGNKEEQTLGMVSVPSIFYGSTIQTGSVSLKYYIDGAMAAELRDIKQNGELIQVTGSNYAQDRGSGSVAGVVLYEEGIILLTGSWQLADEPNLPIDYDGSSWTDDLPKWRNFGAGANEPNFPISGRTAAAQLLFASASFDLSFRGTTETQVMTMFTHAKRGQVNYSNNPTFIKFGQDRLKTTGSHIYEENSERLLANIASSSYANYSASFKRQVFVSKVAIYDDHKNLIGVATLANPVLKQEDEDYTFKLRLDI